MIRSFDLEDNHENLEEQEDNPFDYFLQSSAQAIKSTYHKQQLSHNTSGNYWRGPLLLVQVNTENR
jgi:hypothetical protein